MSEKPIAVGLNDCTYDARERVATIPFRLPDGTVQEVRIKPGGVLPLMNALLWVAKMVNQTKTAYAYRLEKVTAHVGIGEVKGITLHLDNGIDLPVLLPPDKQALLRSALDAMQTVRALEPAKH